MLLLACEKENASASMYNLHAYVSTTKPVYASITWSELKDGQWRTMPAHPLKVLLYENGVSVAAFKEAGMGNYESNYIPKENLSYEVRAVFHNGDTVYGEAKVPQAIIPENINVAVEYNIIDTVYYNLPDYDSLHVQDTVCDLSIEIDFVDFVSVENVYQLTVKKIDASITQYGYESEGDMPMDFNYLNSEPNAIFKQRRKVNSYYYTVFDDAYDGENIKLKFQISDYQIMSFPVRYEVTFVSLSPDTYNYYIDLENREGVYQNLSWNMGFQLTNNWWYSTNPGFVPCSKGNPIVNGFGFIAASAGVVDTIVVEAPR